MTRSALCCRVAQPRRSRYHRSCPARSPCPGRRHSTRQRQAARYRRGPCPPARSGSRCRASAYQGLGNGHASDTPSSRVCAAAGKAGGPAPVTRLLVAGASGGFMSADATYLARRTWWSVLLRERVEKFPELKLGYSAVISSMRRTGAIGMPSSGPVQAADRGCAGETRVDEAVPPRRDNPSPSRANPGSGAASPGRMPIMARILSESRRCSADQRDVACLRRKDAEGIAAPRAGAPAAVTLRGIS